MRAEYHMSSHVRVLDNDNELRASFGYSEWGGKEAAMKAALGHIERLKPVHLNTFLLEEIDRVQQFANCWEKKHAENPDHFPMELELGDWDEMLLGYSVGDD